MTHLNSISRHFICPDHKLAHLAPCYYICPVQRPRFRFSDPAVKYSVLFWTNGSESPLDFFLYVAHEVSCSPDATVFYSKRFCVCVCVCFPLGLPVFHISLQADYTNVPTVVFSHPPMGTCGMTEPQARAEFGDDNVKVYKSTFTNLFFGHWQVGTLWRRGKLLGGLETHRVRGQD